MPKIHGRSLRESVEAKDRHAARLVLELEAFLIPMKDWHTAPREAQDIAFQDHIEGIPTGIAHHPEKGWFVLQSGQGPYIAWREND